MSESLYDNERLRRVITESLAKLNASSLLPALTVEWNRSFTRRAGDASYDVENHKGRIRLSVPLWPRMTLEKRDETLVHELCHVVNRWKYGRVPSHGRHWKHLMLLAGYPNAKRCHTIDRTGLRRKRIRYRCACLCGEILVGPKHYRLLATSSSHNKLLQCRKCKMAVKLIDHKPITI